MTRGDMSLRAGGLYTLFYSIGGSFEEVRSYIEVFDFLSTSPTGELGSQVARLGIRIQHTTGTVESLRLPAQGRIKISSSGGV